MNFEVLKKNKLKKNILIGAMVVLILSAITLTFTRARYRVTHSVPLVSGTINFSPYDFNLIAMYLNQEGAMPAGQTEEVPKFGYTLNQEQSTCIIDDVEDERITMNYVTQTADEKAYITFDKMSQSGTKCTLYFDLIADSQAPTVNMSITGTDTSITVIANASDNIGIYYYYFKLDNGSEIRSEEASYTFDGLATTSVHTITVRVEDAAGNEVVSQEEIIVGSTKTKLLAHYNTILTRTDFNTSITETTTGTIYKSANESQYDNDGEVYYFAGNPTDNWVQFGENNSGQSLYWRIVRINGDESIRLIYNGTSTSQTGSSTMISRQAFNESEYDNAYVGYMYTEGELHGLGTNSDIKSTIDAWYLSNLADEAQYLDGNAGFCGDRTTYSGSGIGSSSTYYAAYNRLSTNKAPTFKCANNSDLYTTPGSSKGNRALKVNSNDSREVPIGLITADEVVFAGAVPPYTANDSYYLYNAASYWTMTPSFFSYNNGNLGFVVLQSGALHSWYSLTYTYGVRPVINLRSDLPLSGSGTTGDPFKVVGAS